MEAILAGNNLERFQFIEGYIEIVYYVTLVLIIAEMGFDFFFLKKRNYKENAANISIAIVAEFTSRILSGILIVYSLVFISQFKIFNFDTSLWTWLVVMLAVDFTYYWEHRLSHRIRLLWANHVVHHSSVDFDLTTSLRLSWMDDFVGWIFYLPLIILGFDPLQVFIALELNLLYQTFVHTQKVGKLGFLEGVLNTPALHRVHHGSNPQYIDKNYGGILIIWDRIFDSYEPEREKVKFGLTENINTVNPIKINFLEYWNIVRDLKKARNWNNFWGYLLAYPGWSPKLIEKKARVSRVKKY